MAISFSAGQTKPHLLAWTGLRLKVHLSRWSPTVRRILAAMNVPTRTTSAIYPLGLRTDLARDVAREYWANQHAEKVKRLPNLVEYNQYHFSNSDRGYWPATPTVGTLVPPACRLMG